MIGVVYWSNPYKLLNGSLFYAYEYFQLLRMHSDVKFFIIGVTPHEFNVISRVFAEKYTTGMDRVVPTDRVTDLYRSGMRIIS